jgi:hypothetical protein
MRRQCTSLPGVLIAGTVATVATIAYAQVPRRSGPLILAADEGDPVGNNYIKQTLTPARCVSESVCSASRWAGDFHAHA